MSRPACEPLWVSRPSHCELTVGDMKWRWHVLVFLLRSFIVVNHAGLPLTDASHPGTAGRWGRPPAHLSGSFSPRTGPRYPVEGQQYYDSTGCLWSPSARAHKQRWPAGAHSTLEAFDWVYVLHYLIFKLDHSNLIYEKVVLRGWEVLKNKEKLN